MPWAEEVSNCSICQEFAGSWWRCMTDPSQDSVDELRISMAAGIHLQDDHEDIVLRPKEGCEVCRDVLAMVSATFPAPGELIIRADGARLHPSQLHFARHVLWDRFDLP
jgi:hypothetical protein